MQPVKPRTVACPKCGASVIWSDENRYRPFCSARCKGMDLGAWASDQYVVSTPASTHDEHADSEQPPTAEH